MSTLSPHNWSCLDSFDNHTFSIDLLKTFDFTPTNDKNSFRQDDITLESFSNSMLTNEEKISIFSSLTNESHDFVIKQHQSPSTSAAAIAAAAEAAVAISSPSSAPPYPMQGKSILKKSSAFFNERILRKSSKPVIQEKRSSNGFTIKQQPEKKSLWRSIKIAFT